ncbi:sensor histidine kinase [Phenylobacterium sp.]|uniref:sensor histidine kinase n=1 Tax=Phenylobacterium sp. TaxID=1871053 RepID=UPI002F40588D
MIDPHVPIDPPFHAIADQIALGMAFQVLVPADGAPARFTYVSPRCLEMNGVPAAAVLADTDAFYGLLLPEHRARLRTIAAAAAAGLESVEMQVALARPDGEVRWSRITAAPHRLENGDLVWDGLQIDVTDRQRAETELEEEHRRLEMAAEATGLGFWELDMRTDALVWTERSKAIFGLPADAEITADSYKKSIHPDDREMVGANYRKAVGTPGGGDFASEYRVTIPSGQTRWVLSHGRVLWDDRGPRVVVGTTLDVTERRSAEERRALVMAELAHRGKNGLSYMMAMVRQAARRAASVADYEAAILSRLEAMARSQDLVTEAQGRSLHLPTLLAAVLQPFDQERFDLAPDLATVKLTNELTLGLTLLVHELATNALKYGALSNDGGRVSVAREAAAPGLTVIRWKEAGGPPVAAPGQSGFGARLMHRALREQGGRVEGRYEPGGFVARLEFPTPL